MNGWSCLVESLVWRAENIISHAQGAHQHGHGWSPVPTTTTERRWEGAVTPLLVPHILDDNMGRDVGTSSSSALRKHDDGALT